MRNDRLIQLAKLLKYEKLSEKVYFSQSTELSKLPEGYPIDAGNKTHKITTPYGYVMGVVGIAILHFGDMNFASILKDLEMGTFFDKTSNIYDWFRDFYDLTTPQEHWLDSVYFTNLDETKEGVADRIIYMIANPNQISSLSTQLVIGDEDKRQEILSMYSGYYEKMKSQKS